MESNQILGAVVTILFGIILLGMGASFWYKSSQPILSSKIRKRGVKTTGVIRDVRNKAIHLTKVAYMMNVEYETPEGTQLYKYQRTITKDRVKYYRTVYGSCFAEGMELPIAYLPDEPDKFMVLHPIEVEEKKRNNQLVIIVIVMVVVLPVVIWLVSGMFR